MPGSSLRGSGTGSTAEPITRFARLGSHWPWFLGAFWGFVFLWTFSPQSDGIVVGNDVVNYADQLGGENENRHQGTPNHLGYHWISVVVYRVLRWWPGSLEGIGLALRAQQIVSALGGALTLIALARLCNRRAGLKIALPFTCALALTQGVWFSSADGDSYLPAMAASAWLLCGALAPAIGGERPSSVALCLLLLASVVIRQDAVLIVPALAVLLPWRNFLGVVGAAGILALAAYTLAWAASGSETSFTKWLMGEGSSDMWGHGWSAGGIDIAFMHLLCIFQPAQLHQPGTGWWTLLPLALALALVARPSAAVLRAVLGCTVYAISCETFYTWWQPENVEYQIPLLLPISAALALLFRPRPASECVGVQAGLLWVTAIALGIGTWTYCVGCYRGSDMSAHSRLALEAAGRDGVVLSLDGWQGLALIRERRFVLGEEIGDTRWVDMNGSASARNPGRAEQLRLRLTHMSRSGRRAVAIGDLVLPPAQIGPDRADAEVLKLILNGLPHVPVLNDEGVAVAHLIEPDVR